MELDFGPSHPLVCVPDHLATLSAAQARCTIHTFQPTLHIMTLQPQVGVGSPLLISGPQCPP